MTTISYAPELGQTKPQNVQGEVDYILGKYFVETSETLEIIRGIRFAYISDKGNNVYEMTKKAYSNYSATRTIARLELLD